MNFKIKFLMFFVTTLNSLPSFTSATPPNPTHSEIGEKYAIANLPKQDATYHPSATEACFTNLWGYWSSDAKDPHKEIEQIIAEGKVINACTLAAVSTSSFKVTTKAPNFVDMLTAVTNENCQALRVIRQRQQQHIYFSLQEQRNNLLKLMTAISWKIRAHKLQPLTRTNFEQNKDLFKQAISESIEREQDLLALIIKEYTARIQALVDIKDLLES